MDEWQSLFVPLVDKLGYNYPEGESLDASLLRKLAIGQALVAGDEGWAFALEWSFSQLYWLAFAEWLRSWTAVSSTTRRLATNLKFLLNFIALSLQRYGAHLLKMARYTDGWHEWIRLRNTEAGQSTMRWSRSMIMRRLPRRRWQRCKWPWRSK